MDFVEPIFKAGLSGGITGGVMAGIGALANNRPTRASVVRAMLAGGLAYGGMGAGSTGLGIGFMGNPRANEPTGYARRGAVGGIVGGAVAGGTMGGLVGSGKLALPEKTPAWLAEYAAKLRRLKGAPLIGGAIGAVGLGVASSFLGAGEGMQLDAIENEMRQKMRRRYG